MCQVRAFDTKVAAWEGRVPKGPGPPKDLGSWQQEAGKQAKDRLKKIGNSFVGKDTPEPDLEAQLPRQMETGLYKTNCHVGLWQYVSI